MKKIVTLFLTLVVILALGAVAASAAFVPCPESANERHAIDFEKDECKLCGKEYKEGYLKVVPNVTTIDIGTGSAEVIYTVSIVPPTNKDTTTNHVGVFQAVFAAAEGATIIDNIVDTKGASGGYWLNTEELGYHKTYNPTGIFALFDFNADAIKDDESGLEGIVAGVGGEEGRSIEKETVVMTFAVRIEDISKAGEYKLDVYKTELGNWDATSFRVVVEGNETVVVAEPPPCAHENTEQAGYVAPTCTEDGYSGDIVCNDCDETLSKGQTISALGHTEKIIPAVAPTCVKDGLKEGKMCEVCKISILAQVKDPAFGHDEEVIPAVDATCTTDGATEGKKCKVCGEITVEPEIIEAAHGETELVGASEPTCVDKGYTGDLKCTVCDEIVEEGEEIDLIDHDYVDGTCTVCGAKAPATPETGDVALIAVAVLVLSGLAFVICKKKKASAN